MQISKKKTAALVIALFLVSIVSGSMLNANATVGALFVTHAFVEAVPDTTGVGQATTIYMWLDYVFPNAAIGNTNRWHNYTVSVTDPNGTITTANFDMINDTTSNQAYTYTPTMLGTYNISFTFPGQFFEQYSPSVNTTSYVGNYYEPSNNTCKLIVQQEPIATLPDSYPLPTQYWTRPIYGENNIWFTITSNWLGTGAVGYGMLSGLYTGSTFFKLPTDSIGPMTPHIMWTKGISDGGVVGGNMGGVNGIYGNTYFDGSAYNQRFQNPIIVDGKLVYNGQSGYLSSNYHTYVVDLRTGAVILDSSTATTYSFAYVPDLENGDQHGVVQPLLCTSNFGSCYDLLTQTSKFSTSSVPSGTSTFQVLGPQGETMKYIIGTNTISLWNSTKMWGFSTLGSSYPSGSQASSASKDEYYNTLLTYQNLNFTAVGTPQIVGAIYGDQLVAENGTMPTTAASEFIGTNPSYNQYTYFGVNLNATRAPIGQVMWMDNIQPPIDNQGVNATVLILGIDPTTHVFVEGTRETNQFTGYSMVTGAQLWQTAGQNALDYYGSQSSGTIENSFDFGNMYVSAYDGIVYCYNTTTGAVTWTYGEGGPGNSTQGGNQVPGRYPTFVAAFGSNGVIYTITSEHTIETPIYKGAETRCLNATTGAEIWVLSSYVNEFQVDSFAMADGYATWFNSYDNQIYSVGQGPTKLSVSAPDIGAAPGQPVIISGTVYDTSAGSQEPEQIARFPYGLPCASDSMMTSWMSYVYQQKPMPANFTGVPVTISVVDSNGNTRTIGTATTDATGAYNLIWTPDISGDYSVTASFAGSQAYYGSYATTTFAVMAPASATPLVVTPTPISLADQYILPIGIAIIVVVLLIGAVLALLVLRKKP